MPLDSRSGARIRHVPQTDSLDALMSELRRHELSAAFGMLADDELQKLADDIKANGQREPGIMYEGQILDGYHRALACEIAGVEFQWTPLLPSIDPVKYVISRNLHRRHLNASQRALAIVRCCEWQPGGKPAGDSDSAPSGMLVDTNDSGNCYLPLSGRLTNKQMADEVEVSRSTIVDAKVVHTNGGDLAKEVEEGRLSVKSAAAQLTKREPKPKPKPEKPNEVEALKAELTETREALADIKDTARELEQQLTVFEKTEIDDQQKEIAKLQKQVVQLQAEVKRQRVMINDCQFKNNELIRQVKRLRKNA